MEDDILHAFLLTNHGGVPYYSPAGRLLINNNWIHVLENPYNLLDYIPAGPIDEVTQAILAAGPPAHLNIAKLTDLLNGHNLNYIPEKTLGNLFQYPEVDQTQIQAAGQAELPEHSVFHYHRVGMDKPHVLESHSTGQAYLDGNELSPEEQDLILTNISNGLATLQHLNTLGKSLALSKSLDEESFLAKMDPNEALLMLERMHANHPQGAQASEALKALRTQIYEDPRIPGLGNKYAHDQFMRSQGRGGHTVILDGDNLKHANDTYGHSTGDKLIGAWGKAIKEAADEVAPGQHKSFAFGGDEFKVHLPTEQHAHQFARAVTTKLGAMNPVAGQLKPSMSVGLGPDHETADKALYHAKAKKANYLAAGGARHETPSHVSTHQDLAPVTPGPDAPFGKAPATPEPMAKKTAPEPISTKKSA